MPRMPVAEIKRRLQKLEATQNKAAKGAPVIVSIDEVPNSYFLRRPSGIMPLDVQTGGGLPAGGLIYISGPDNAGKNFLINKHFAMQQKLLGSNCSLALGAVEGPPDHFFMRKCGVKVAIPDDMIEERQKYRKEQGLPAYTKDELKEFKTQIGSFKIIRNTSAETILNTIIDAVDSKAFDIVALDSVSALISENEQGKDLDENPQQAAVAAAMTRFFQHYLTMTTGFSGKNETTVIFTAQARSNRRKSEMQSHIAKYMKEWSTTGAWAARHGKLIDITVWNGAKEKEEVKTIGLGEDDSEKKYKKKVQTGKTIQWEITKGKAGTHDGLTGEVEFNYERLTDDMRLVIIEGMRYGCILERDGEVTVLKKLTGEPVEGLTALPGVEGLINQMKEDFEVELWIRREVLASAGIACTYR